MHTTRVLSGFTGVALALGLMGCGGDGTSAASTSAEPAFAQVALDIGRSMLAYSQSRPLPANGRFVCADRPIEYAQDWTTGLQLPADAHVYFVATSTSLSSYAHIVDATDRMTIDTFVTPDGQVSYTRVSGRGGSPASANRTLTASFPEAIALAGQVRAFMQTPGCARPQRYRAATAQALGMPAPSLDVLPELPDTTDGHICQTQTALFAAPDPWYLSEDVRAWVGVASSTKIIIFDLYIRSAGERACLMVSGAVRHDPTTGAIVPWRQ